MPHPTKKVHKEEENRKQDKEGHNQNKDGQAPDESSNDVGDIGEFTNVGGVVDFFCYFVCLFSRLLAESLQECGGRHKSS